MNNNTYKELGLKYLHAIKFNLVEMKDANLEISINCVNELINILNEAKEINNHDILLVSTFMEQNNEILDVVLKHSKNQANLNFLFTQATAFKLAIETINHYNFDLNHEEEATEPLEIFIGSSLASGILSIFARNINQLMWKYLKACYDKAFNNIKSEALTSDSHEINLWDNPITRTKIQETIEKFKTLELNKAKQNILNDHLILQHWVTKSNDEKYNTYAQKWILILKILNQLTNIAEIQHLTKEFNEITNSLNNLTTASDLTSKTTLELRQKEIYRILANIDITSAVNENKEKALAKAQAASNTLLEINFPNLYQPTLIKLSELHSSDFQKNLNIS